MEGKINVFGDADVLFAVYKDGTYSDTIPRKSDGYSFKEAKCTNNATASWNRSNWSVTVNSLTKAKTKCSLYFVTGSVTGEQSGENKMEDLLDKESNKVQSATMVSDDNNIRYIGASPNNWVTFNGESWRIIGLMDGIQTSTGKTERLLKIIRNDSLGKYSWDKSPSKVNYAQGINEWSQADLMYALKKYGGDTSVGNTCGDTDCPTDWVTLNSDAQNMIEEVVWNTGTAYTTNWSDINVTPLQYKWERSGYTGKQCTETDCTSDTVIRQTTWLGKVGLMYPSDYGYATDGGGTTEKRETCLFTRLINWNDIYSWSKTSDCYTNDWLLDSSSDQWTMTPGPESSYSSQVFEVNNRGSVSDDHAYNAYAVRPVVYLKSSVKITGGTGEKSNPYQLKLG